MNRLRKYDYIQLIAETLVKTYGGTLIEGDTDLRMARAVERQLSNYLYYHPLPDSKQEFNEWRKLFKHKYGYK